MSITKQDFFNFSGINLDIELKKSRSDNPTRAVEIFLQRNEDFVLEYLESHYLFDRDDDYDTDAFNRALLYQVEYRLSHGEDGRLGPSALWILRKAGMCEITYERESTTWQSI